MNKFGLEARYIDFLLEVFKKYLSEPNAKYYVFGSRAQGSYKEFSDIDIALDNNGEKLSENIISQMVSDIENSTFPYEVDIVDLNAISENFKNLIVNDLLEL